MEDIFSMCSNKEPDNNQNVFFQEKGNRAEDRLSRDLPNPPRAALFRGNILRSKHLRARA